MQTSPAGRAAIARREGNKLTAYQDSVSVWTIGVGHTSAAGPPKVTKGMKITAAESDEILARDLSAVEAAVSSLVEVPLSQNEFDALVSLVFNIGAGAFKKSTVLRSLNGGNRTGAADAMLAWNKGTVNGKKVALRGLTTRRQDERAQFLSKEQAAVEPSVVKDLPATPATNATVTIADGPKKDETVVVIAQTPQAPPAPLAVPTSKAGFMVIGAFILTLLAGAFRYFFGG